MTLLAQRSLDEAMSVKAVSRISSGSVAGIFGGWGAIRPAILQSGHHDSPYASQHQPLML